MTGRDAGLTLLEMLVALVVFGLVMAGLTRSFQFGLTAWSEQTRIVRSPTAMAAVEGALRRIIDAARPGTLVGHPNGIAFTTTLPPGAGLGDRLADVAIRVLPDHRLVLRFTPHPPGIPLGPPPHPRIETLARGVAALRIAYLIPRRAAGPAWRDRWAGPGLPLLVRLGIRFTGKPAWPDLVAAPVDTGANE